MATESTKKYAAQIQYETNLTAAKNQHDSDLPLEIEQVTNL